MNKQKKWFLFTITGSISVLMFILILMVIFDPYFHYHEKIPGLSYRLYYERYINPGIVKNFEYDTIITGSSMNQNFKTSQLDKLWGTNSVKVAFSGAGFREIKENLDRAFESGNEIKYVLWGLDYNGIYREGHYKKYEEYPEYLYDKNPLNDVSYVWNKELIFQGLFTNLLMTLQGEESTSFDEYGSWEGGRGLESILKLYQRSEEILPMQTEITPLDEYILSWNIESNIIQLVNEHPDTQFILFYTPYSALYWESIFRDGTLEKQILCEKMATEMMLECENIHLFTFVQETEITNDLNNYRDKEHYVAEINELILQWITEGKGLLTKENYEEIIEWEREYYMNYDYDSLY